MLVEIGTAFIIGAGVVLFFGGIVVMGNAIYDLCLNIAQLRRLRKELEVWKRVHKAAKSKGE